MEAKKILKLDEIWWIVTPKNPLKIINPAIYKERINNCKNITKNKPIKIVEIEKKINSKFSYQTINYINNHYKHIKFFWLMGADNLINIHKWKKWKEVYKADIGESVNENYELLAYTLFLIRLKHYNDSASTGI